MNKRYITWAAAIAMTAGIGLGGCEEKPGEFREMPEDGPPPAANMPDPGDPHAGPAEGIAPPPPAATR